MKRIYIKVGTILGIFLTLILCNGVSTGSSDQTLDEVTSFDNYKFIFLGDTRPEESDNTGCETLATMINTLKQEHDIEFILHSGDVVWDGSVQAQWDTYWWPNFGSIAAEIPIFYAVGNHEYDYGFQTEATLETYVANVDNPGNEVYYSFNTPQNDTHIIVLNTYFFIDAAYNNFQNLTLAAEQQAWLENDLATNNISRIIAMTHTPFWNLNPSPDRLTAAQNTRDAWHDLFVQYGVDLVISGHAHNFYNTFRNGTWYTTSGGGTSDFSNILIAGPILDTYLPEDYYFTDANHLCLVEVSSEGYDVGVITPNMSYVYNYSVSAAIEGLTTTSESSTTVDPTTTTSDVMTTTDEETTTTSTPGFSLVSLILIFSVTSIIYRKQRRK